MKIYPGLFLIIIGILGCVRQNPINDLPSQELRDTLIKEALLQSSIPLLPDTINKNEIPRKFCYVYKDIQCYSLVRKITSPVINTVNEFSFDYILSLRFTQNGQKVFLPKDTTYFNAQISTYKPYRLDGFSNYPIRLIDKNEIKKQVLLNMESQKSHKFFRFNCITIYMPILNIEKNFAIVGIEEFDYSEIVNSICETYYVLKKTGKKWVVTNVVPWKNKN